MTGALRYIHRKAVEDILGREQCMWLPLDCTASLYHIGDVYIEKACVLGDFEDCAPLPPSTAFIASLYRNQGYSLSSTSLHNLIIMRLINTKTFQFHWVDDPRRVHYAVLSHVWSKKGDPHYTPERTFQEVCAARKAMHDQNPMDLEDAFSTKIKKFCDVARDAGFNYAWADTCCIDKTDSSELSESINSMYDWYSYAGTCYVFLHDVDGNASPQEQEEQFRNSKWLKRGWTLQELLAPNVLVYLTNKWTVIGSKFTHAGFVEGVTNIPSEVLTGEVRLDEVSVARRMSWAASRETTREEDEAYCLMGIFGVKIPTNYGEGRYAFIRLQEEIIKHIPDQTIFAWGPFRSRVPDDSLSTLSSNSPSPAISMHLSFMTQYLLASSPKDFEHSFNISRLSREAFAMEVGISPSDIPNVPVSITAYGIHMKLPLIQIPNSRIFIALLQAYYDCSSGERYLPALLLRPQTQNSSSEYFVGTIIGNAMDFLDRFASDIMLSGHYLRGMLIPTRDAPKFSFSHVYIAPCPSLEEINLARDAPSNNALCKTRDSFSVRLAGWSKKLLILQGYQVSMPGNIKDDPRKDHAQNLAPSSFTISKGADVQICIQAGRCGCPTAKRNGLLSLQVSFKGGSRCLVGESSTEPHDHLQHPSHICSWELRRRVAFKEMVFESSKGQEFGMRLTFTHDPSESSNAYRLGVELRELFPLPSPTTPLQPKSSTAILRSPEDVDTVPPPSSPPTHPPPVRQQRDTPQHPTIAPSQVSHAGPLADAEDDENEQYFTPTATSFSPNSLPLFDRRRPPLTSSHVGPQRRDSQRSQHWGDSVPRVPIRRPNTRTSYSTPQLP